MPKQVTKQELVNMVNEKFYNIPTTVLYNTFTRCGAGQYIVETHKDHHGEEPTIEQMKEYFKENFLPEINDTGKLQMLGSCIDYLLDVRIEVIHNEYETKKHYRNLQELVKGCDTMEKLDMLKKLPLMKVEDECECECEKK